MTPRALPWRHVLLALAVVAVWGTNFVVIKLALGHLPPLLFAALRFVFALLPAVFFLPQPRVPWHNLAGYGLCVGAGQFGLLYLAMRADISPGLASLVVQTQVFFTIGLAIWLGGERVRPYQWAALGLAVAGIAVIGTHTDGTTTPTGLVLVLLASFSWACANSFSKRAGAVNMVAYVVWSSFYAVPPLLLLSFLVDGGPAMAEGLRRADLATWAAVLWQSVGNALFGFAAWGWLLSRHPAAQIVPMALLVPVFGMTAASVWLGEPLPPWKLAAAALVMAGLAMNLWWPRLAARWRPAVLPK